MIVPMNLVLGLSGVLFGIGVFGFLARRNIILMLISIEIMLTAINISLAGFSQQLGNLDGQVLALFVIAIAAVEAAIGLGLLIALNRNQPGTDVSDVSKLKG
ncbi:MAG: NADH-quinone oxidoreductase subunit NuoK [Pirellulaceae bacterium]|jgi:NADH-quinone oxidoreductase subunit K